MTEGEKMKLLAGFVLGTIFSGVCTFISYYNGAGSQP